jgi:predicted nuclease with TOPRIM domain
MAKKATKQQPLLRIRLDPKLVARLEGAREANGNTLTGEIVMRLEETFRRDEKVAEMAASRDALTAELAELRSKFSDARVENARLEEQLKRWNEGSHAASALVDAEPGLFPEQLRVAALMLVSDPRAQEAARNMFAALRAEKKPPV